MCWPFCGRAFSVPEQKIRTLLRTRPYEFWYCRVTYVGLSCMYVKFQISRFDWRATNQSNCTIAPCSWSTDVRYFGLTAGDSFSLPIFLLTPGAPFLLACLISPLWKRKRSCWCAGYYPTNDRITGIRWICKTFVFHSSTYSVHEDTQSHLLAIENLKTWANMRL